jgi:serine protease Do
VRAEETLVRLRLLAGALALAVLAAGCGSDDSKDEAASDAAAGAIDSMEDVESAVVRIVATGTFVDPEIGVQYDVAGSGSGFIIDGSGIAVTNNHVVTGAATLEVYVGDDEEPKNAKVLGVSECSDLAVIDIAGEGYPFLAWHEGEVDTNLDVRALGYPLGDPEFTVTRGIVSKAEADGETDWASVDSVIEHDAKINPGNSGGPLVDEDARVVGVNYAGASDTDQNFAISAELAKPVVDQLRKKQNVDSLGINGQAIFDENTGITGVWAASVETGSPADEAGIKSGDIVVTLENLGLAYEGTMKEYCDVLQSRDPEDKLKVEVLRYSTEEYLAGEINGDELELSFSFADEFDDEVSDTETGGYYTEYVVVTDDSGAISVEVPAEWTDVDGTASEVGPSVVAAPDIAAFDETWDVPGVRVSASDQVGSDLEALLDELGAVAGACTSGGREDFETPFYAGRTEFFSECGDTGASFVTLAAVPSEGTYTVVIAIQLTSDADLEALDRILNTFQITGGF